MRSLVTGVAGFIGSHLAERLIAEGDEYEKSKYKEISATFI